MKTGIIVFAHGSSVEPANDAVRCVAEEMARAGGYELVEAAFLGPGSPTLHEAVPRLVARGASRIVIVPYFLTLGTHLQRDLPRLAAEVAGCHAGVTIEIAEPLDGHPGLREILLDRVRSALKEP